MADYWTRVEESLRKIEDCENPMLLDQAAWLVGIGKNFITDLEYLTRDCPKIQVLILEMKPITVRPLYGLSLMPYIDRDDDLGRLADSIRKALF